MLTAFWGCLIMAELQTMQNKSNTFWFVLASLCLVADIAATLLKLKG